ncbi:MAG: hypothetical protein AB7O79_06735 [Xanthobacteraceae bacterium]
MAPRVSRPTDKIVLRAGLNIGQLAAEDDDDFLKDSFVHPSILAQLLSLKDPASVILGRTGSGKTAILKHIQIEEENVYEIAPKDVSLNYIANSTVIRFFHNLGVDLDLFYQLLWRHVIAVELIRRRHKIDSEAENTSFLSRLADWVLKSEQHRAAVDYLRNWQSKFWITWDERIKEIATKFEGQLETAAESAVPGINLKAGGKITLTDEQKSQLTQRAQAVVNEVQVADLARVIELLSESAFGDKQSRFFLLIDNLDEKWVDESIRFKLIRALIETLPVFRRIPALKIVVALRADILERVYAETRDLGFQLDKYEGRMARLSWSKENLKTIVDRRIQSLFKRQYTKEDVTISEIFPYKIGQTDPLEYIMDRTLMRPRDIIAYVNECFRAAEGRSEIIAQIVRTAEQEYSRKRLNAILDEWQSVHPNLSVGVAFLANRSEVITFDELTTKEVIEDIALKISSSTQRSSDEIQKAAQSVFENTSAANILHFAKQVVCILYKVGLIGIKLDNNRPFQYCYTSAPIIMEHQISGDCRLRIHPMFWRALNTKVGT